MYRVRLIIALIFTILPSISLAQFSSCAQPNFLTSLDYRNLPARTWQFGASYNYKSLSKLITGSNTLDDETRSRLTGGLSFRTGYGISDKLSVSTIVNYVQKSIEIRLPSVGREYLKTRGLGDTYIIGEYSLQLWELEQGKKLSVGGGIKIPTGKTDYSSDEILIRDDMQPGTGSWDFLLWANTIRMLKQNAPGYLYLEAGYRLNGENDTVNYGNEVFGSAGLMFLPEYIGRFSGYVRYSSMDKFKDESGNVIQNTGGSWMTLVGDVKADISRKLFGRLTLEVPVKQNLKGTQLGPEYIVTLSFQYTLLN